MTKQEATEIRSALCNGFQLPFGKGLVEDCDTKEVERRAQLFGEAINKHILKQPIDIVDSHLNCTMGCPNCGQPIVNVWNRSGYTPK